MKVFVQTISEAKNLLAEEVFDDMGEAHQRFTVLHNLTIEPVTIVLSYETKNHVGKLLESCFPFESRRRRIITSISDLENKND